MCDRMDINIWEAVEAASTKPFGYIPFYPGPGIGGHCIPLDPSYLRWKAESVGFHNRFIKLATDLKGADLLITTRMCRLWRNWAVRSQSSLLRRLWRGVMR